MKLELFAKFELDFIVDEGDRVFNGVKLSVLVFLQFVVGGDGHFLVSQSDTDGGIGGDVDLFGIQNHLHVLHLPLLYKLKL
jgi:hypothetical protein